MQNYIIPDYPCVYLVREPHRGNYKIGYSTQLAKRMGELNILSYAPLTLVDTVIESKSNVQLIEKCLHRFLNKYHVRGEWFALPNLLVWKETVRKVLFQIDRLPCYQVFLFNQKKSLDAQKDSRYCDIWEEWREFEREFKDTMVTIPAAVAIAKPQQGEPAQTVGEVSLKSILSALDEAVRTTNIYYD